MNSALTSRWISLSKLSRENCLKNLSDNENKVQQRLYLWCLTFFRIRDLSFNSSQRKLQESFVNFIKGHHIVSWLSSSSGQSSGNNSLTWIYDIVSKTEPNRKRIPMYFTPCLSALLWWIIGNTPIQCASWHFCFEIQTSEIFISLTLSLTTLALKNTTVVSLTTEYWEKHLANFEVFGPIGFHFRRRSFCRV